MSANNPFKKIGGSDGKGPESPKQKSKTEQVQQQVIEVQDIMHKNIENLVRNVDNLEVLQDKTETMRENAKQFKSGATSLKRSMWWRNVKIQILIVIIVLIILLAIIIPIVRTFSK